MAKLVWSILASSALSMPSQMSAHDIKLSSASGLLENCTYDSNDNAENEHHLGLCLGFIKAAMNYHPTHGKTFCIPEDWGNEDLVRFVRTALLRLPPKMREDAASTVVLGVVFEAGLPCSQK